MTPGARLQAVIEILDALPKQQLPADAYFRKWAREHRYAGSRDRRAIKDDVFLIQRRRNEMGDAFDDADGRALVLAMLKSDPVVDVPVIEGLFSGAQYHPDQLSQKERAYLTSRSPISSEPWVQGNYPCWLHDELFEQFGADVSAEMQAMSERAPFDIRVNTLKTTVEEVQSSLNASGADWIRCAFAQNGLRLGEEATLTATPSYQEGHIEIQDEGAQIAAALAMAKPGNFVVDLAAGAGGKSLAMAADMSNKGEILACDIDARKLQETDLRAMRAGVSIIKTQEIAEYAPDEGLDHLRGSADIVMVDAPCSGSGTWRRSPDQKWRFSDARLQELGEIQRSLLELGAGLLKAGGRLVYVTCSLLPIENRSMVNSFLDSHPELRKWNPKGKWWDSRLRKPLPLEDGGIQLTPWRHKTDGFFISVLERV